MKFSDPIKLCILFILSLSLSVIDINNKYKNCVESVEIYKIIPTILAHRFISVFVYFGWLFDNKVILISYVAFLILLLLHWVTNDWKCIITEYENEICNFPDDTVYDPTFNILGNSDFAGYIYTIINITLGVLAIYKILKY